MNQERVLTTSAEAAKNGWTNPIPVHEGDVDKYRSAQVQFNDVQSNLSRFRSAAQRAMKEGMNPLDGPRIDNIINQSGIAELQVKIAEGGEIKVPILNAFLESVNRESRSMNYKSLSPAGKDLVDGYFRTMAAVPAYQKALSNIGRSNKEMLELELANIPNPTMAPADIMRKLQAFQENVDQGSAGIPRMPGIPTIKDIRQKFESSGQQPTVGPDLQRLLGGIQ